MLFAHYRLHTWINKGDCYTIVYERVLIDGVYTQILSTHSQIVDGFSSLKVDAVG